MIYLLLFAGLFMGWSLGTNDAANAFGLRVLKNTRLVKPRREGKTVFYSLADDHVRRIIAQGMEHIEE